MITVAFSGQKDCLILTCCVLFSKSTCLRRIPGWPPEVRLSNFDIRYSGLVCRVFLKIVNLTAFL